MTSEKKSTLSLKQWVRRVKRYEYELPLLYEKLEYLKVKSIGYHSPSFEPRLSSNGSFNHKGIDYWLEKIEECELKISSIEKETTLFKLFLNSLSKREKIIVDNFYIKSVDPKSVLIELKITRHKVYCLIKKMNEEMIKFINKNNCINVTIIYF